jgi:hypothetical protein
MKIRQLQQREPIGPILERTLAAFWGLRSGQAYDVRWEPWWQTSDRSRLAEDVQCWLCNTRLNVIFCRDVRRSALEPVFREFSRSTARWRRPFQRAYMRVALDPRTAPFMSDARLLVMPPLADHRDLIIVAGNHKIRILNRHCGVAYAVTKTGSSCELLAVDQRSRERAGQLGIPVPAVRESHLDDGWLCEDYVCGTPANRLASATEARAVLRRALGCVSKLASSSLTTLPLSDYATDLVQRIEGRLCRFQLAPATVRPRLSQACRILHDCLVKQTATRTDVILSLTHGDLQPGNVLVDASRFWLIDWEYCDQRQSAYDLLTLLSSARRPHGLARRLSWLVRERSRADVFLPDGPWPGLAWDSAEARRQHADLFLLEELDYHLREHDEPNLVSISAGGIAFARELEHWLRLRRSLA